MNGRIDLEMFFRALQMVEVGNLDEVSASQGDWDGTVYRSLGPLQISSAYWFDADVGGQYDEVMKQKYARKVVVCYWLRYCWDAYVGEDWETLARIHNGGPRGHEKEATVEYWEKVEAELERMLAEEDARRQDDPSDRPPTVA